MPNLTGTEKHPPKWKLEYLTFAPQALHPPVVANETEETWKAKEKFAYPIPLRHLPRKLRKGAMTKSKYMPYSMDDLTIPSWTSLARRLAKAGKNSTLRRRFRRYMYQGADAEL
jgi:endopolyphosphatase